MRLRALKGRMQISAAFRKGKRFIVGPATVSARPRRYALDADAPRGGEIDVFLVCAVRKKLVPHAVVRNRIKRLVRESVRAYCKQYEHQGKRIPLMTLAFNWQSSPKKPADIVLDEVKPLVFDVLNQAIEYFSASSLHKIEINQ